MPSYNIVDDPKELRETLAAAQMTIGNFSTTARTQEHIERLQRLINECDRKRPLGPDGKHGNRHTPECGCEDVPLVEVIIHVKDFYKIPQISTLTGIPVEQLNILFNAAYQRQEVCTVKAKITENQFYTIKNLRGVRIGE